MRKLDSLPSTKQKFDAFLFWLSENDCSEDEKKEIVDSFDLDNFTAEKLLKDVRLSGLYSISTICSKAIDIVAEKNHQIRQLEENIDHSH